MVVIEGDCWRWLLVRWVSAALFCLAVCQAESGATGGPVDRQQTEPLHADFVLKGGTLIDGTGRRGDGPTLPCAVRGSWPSAGSGRSDGPGSSTSSPGRRAGVHRPAYPLRSRGSPEPATRLNLNYLTQGVTTIVTGNCGLGVLDVGKYLATIDAHGAGTNVIHLVPHGTVRSTVMGNADRPPSRTELERMKQLVERGMEAGAWGISSGLDLRARPVRRDGRADRAVRRWRRSTGGSTPRTSATKGRGLLEVDRRGDRDRQGAQASRCISRT